MLSNHKLLGSAAGPEELAAGPESLSTLTPCSQWLPHSLWPSWGLRDSRMLEVGAGEALVHGPWSVMGKPSTASRACSWEPPCPALCEVASSGYSWHSRTRAIVVSKHLHAQVVFLELLPAVCHVLWIAMLFSKRCQFRDLSWDLMA